MVEKLPRIGARTNTVALSHRSTARWLVRSSISAPWLQPNVTATLAPVESSELVAFTEDCAETILDIL